VKKWKWMGIFSTIAMTCVAATPDFSIPQASESSWLLKYGGELSRLGVCGILGVVALVSIRMTMKLYLDKEMANKELIQTLNNTIKENTQTQQSVRDAMVNCKR
jgi:hypothetical protein